MIVFGTHKFGWIDHVDGLGTVATRFVHVMWIPLIPLGSYIMVDDDRGITIPLDLKSVLYAWIRSFFLWSALLSWIGVPFTGVSCCTAIPATAIWYALSLPFKQASPERAEQLRRLALQR